MALYLCGRHRERKLEWEWKRVTANIEGHATVVDAEGTQVVGRGI